MSKYSKVFEILDESGLNQVNDSLQKILNRPSIVFLEGPMGAGKTTFVSGFLKKLGVKGGCSPTFALHHTYYLENSTIDHIDLYRLVKFEELEAIGFFDLLEKENLLLFVEWGNRIDKEIFPNHIQKILIKINILKDNIRKFEIRNI